MSALPAPTAWSSVYVGGTGTAVGHPDPADRAIVEGRYSIEGQEHDGYVCTRVLDKDETMLDLAVRAADTAVARAGVCGQEVGLVIHASAQHDRPTTLAPASFIQDHTIGGPGVAMEINQHSNGGLLALQLAAAYLDRPAGPGAALLTAGELLPASRHYEREKGVVFGDGATAMVVTTRPGPARLLASGVLGDSAYHGLHEEPSDGARDVRLEFLLAHSDELMKMVASLGRLQRQCASSTLEVVGLRPDDVDWWVFSNTGLSQVDWQLWSDLGVELDRTAWEWGRETGHLGAGDQFGGLNHLLETGRAGAGDRVALCGVGFGFTVSTAVVEVMEHVAWT